MNITRNKLAMAIGVAISCASALFTSGCHSKSKDLEKCIEFSRHAGTTVGYVISTSVVTVNPEVRELIVAVTTAVATQLPSNVTVETLAVDLMDVSTNAVHAAFPEICEKHPELVKASISALLDFVQMRIELAGQNQAGIQPGTVFPEIVQAHLPIAANRCFIGVGQPQIRKIIVPMQRVSQAVLRIAEPFMQNIQVCFMRCIHCFILHMYKMFLKLHGIYCLFL